LLSDKIDRLAVSSILMVAASEVANSVCALSTCHQLYKVEYGRRALIGGCLAALCVLFQTSL
jgi:hypothetical protein